VLKVTVTGVQAPASFLTLSYGSVPHCPWVKVFDLLLELACSSLCLMIAQYPAANSVKETVVVLLMVQTVPGGWDDFLFLHLFTVECAGRQGTPSNCFKCKENSITSNASVVSQVAKNSVLQQICKQLQACELCHQLHYCANPLCM